MALIVATLLLFAAGPFVLWPLIKTPVDDFISPPPGESLSPPHPLGRSAPPEKRALPGGGV
jgi:hypothetical protein